MCEITPSDWCLQGWHTAVTKSPIPGPKPSKNNSLKTVQISPPIYEEAGQLQERANAVFQALCTLLSVQPKPGQDWVISHHLEEAKLRAGTMTCF